jgi:hypothetical protein
MALAFHRTSGFEAPAGVLWSSRRAHLVVVAPPVAAAPARRSRAVYRRRRLAVGLAVAIVTLLSVTSVASWADRQVGEPASSPLAVNTSLGLWLPSDDGGLRYVVAEGDSLWGIAQRLQAGGSVPALVERFVTVHGSARLMPGQVLEIRP